MIRWIGPHGTNDRLELASNLLSCFIISSHHTEIAAPFICNYEKCILVAHNLACVQDLGISGLAKEKSVVGKIDLGLNQYLASFNSEFPINLSLTIIVS